MTICGIDEAGRGALAGPIVAAAVLLDSDNEQKLKSSRLTIKDSKLLSKLKRELVYKYIQKNTIFYRTEIISARRINNRGIQRANRECIKELIRKIEADSYIVDGKIKLGRVQGKTKKIKTIVDADATILPVMLAGIVAKVTRDQLMQALHFKYFKYNWSSNAGYGTKDHLEALTAYGTTRYHRNIFVTTALRNLFK